VTGAGCAGPYEIGFVDLERSTREWAALADLEQVDP
jgi:hypothetical protein